MATDITGIWDYVWTGDVETMKHHTLDSINMPPISRVCFVSVGGGRYRGRFYDPELPQRSYPNWPYDSTFDVQVLSSSTPGQEFDAVSMVLSFRSSEDVAVYDAYEAIAGQIRTDYQQEPAPIMFGFVYGNNGDVAVWKMTNNVLLSGCPESVFEG